MYMIVGLGNPGDEYAHTRHNAGFDVLDALAPRIGVVIRRSRDNALIGEGFIGGQKVILVKPQTFMNRSGDAVSPLANWYKIEPDHLMIVYDDIELAPGALRIRKNGSAGTHNGMRSIVASLGREDFPRLRVGVGERREGYELADWVLGHYSLEGEQEAADKAFALAADALECWVKEGIDNAMNRYNTKNRKSPNRLTYLRRIRPYERRSVFCLCLASGMEAAAGSH